MAVRLTGPLDVDRLTAALNDVIRRHEILRTVFVAENGAPAQVIVPEVMIEIPVVDLSLRPMDERHGEFRKRVQSNAETSFALHRGPLLKAELVSFAEDDHVLLVAMHHIIADGWSVGILISDLAMVYESRVSNAAPLLPPARLQYADYAAW